IKLGLQDIGKIRMGCYWTAQRLAKAGLIPKKYIERCPFCNKNTPETIEHMLIECFRWNSIRHETTIFNIPRLYRTVTIDQSTNNQALNQGRNIMVGKLLGGESKETRSLLAQSRDRYSPYMKELETGRFMNGIRVVRTLILDRININLDYNLNINVKANILKLIYNVLNKQCIRHLTMSTTDPSAAKPDGFAIGSISKRDRSGSGDEAAPVYPVKHPTMSYAGAAKGRPAAQSSNLLNYYSNSNSKNYQKNQQNPTKQQKNVKNQKPLKNSLPDYNPQKAVDESIYHWYTGGEKQKLKKLCMGGSECKIGCSWDQFGDNASDAVESICRQLFDLRMTMQHDRPSKSTYYIVKDEQAAERLLN
ncbi:hypothetical protein BB560_006108, partial [Smittium megazygosporum]